MERYVTILHPIETRDYKLVSVGKLFKDSYFYFEIELSSYGKKYRSLTRILQSNIEVIEELSWTETIEISLDHYRLDLADQLFITKYQKLLPEDMKTSLFRMVDRYTRNNNPMLMNADILGAVSKPQNLGFIYKIFYVLPTSELVIAEIYAESFTEKINQISVSYLNFDNSFIGFSTEGVQTEKILAAIKAKVDLTAHTGDFIVKEILGKDFLYSAMKKLIDPFICSKYLVNWFKRICSLASSSRL